MTYFRPFLLYLDRLPSHPKDGYQNDYQCWYGLGLDYSSTVPQGQTKAISRSSKGQITHKLKQFITFCTIYCILLDI